MNLNIFRKHDIDSYWFPFLEKLYDEGIVKVGDVIEATVIKDIVHACTRDEVSIRGEDAIYVIFVNREEKSE